jgi:hypothetical protein
LCAAQRGAHLRCTVKRGDRHGRDDDERQEHRFQEVLRQDHGLPRWSYRMCLCLCLCLYVMDWGVWGGMYLLELILPSSGSGNPRSPCSGHLHMTPEEKRHAAHTAQSRTARSDACRMGHPRRRGYCTGTLGHWASYRLCVFAHSTRSQLKLEGRVALDLFGIPALLERLEGDPEISKSDCLCTEGAGSGRRRVSALADSR